MPVEVILGLAEYLVSNPFSVAFWLGLLTPLTAACVLPLYPGFLSYLSRQFSGEEKKRETVFLFGLTVVAGVTLSMMLVGILFTTILEISLTSSIALVTPVAMGLMALVGLLLMLDLDFERYLPGGQAPEFENPIVNAFGFGFFFGLVVLPCNPGFIAVLFARSTLFQTPTTNILRFIVFGLGMGFPLLLFSAISSRWSEKIIGTLNIYSEYINRVSGLILFIVAVYYLSCQFGFLPGFGLC